jgi:hypothetical protein
MAHSAAKFQLRRAIEEYACWRAVEEDERSQAPAWWWSPAFAMRDDPDEMPARWAGMMGLPLPARYADAAQLLLRAMAGQTSLPWPTEFPRRYRPVEEAGVATA